MKKIFTLLFSLIIPLSSSVFADDLWDNFGDSNVYGQQSVSDEEFEKALQSKKKRGKKFKKDKNVPKGETFSQSNETEIINETKSELPVLMVPIPLKIQEKYTIPIGHYQVEGEKDESGNVFIKLYQAHDVIAKIPAEETNDDWGEDVINFVKLQPHGEHHVEILYGGLDFNAFAIIDIE